MTKLQVQWRITGLPNIIITPDKRVYQLPYDSLGRSHAIRELIPKKHEGKDYYRINKRRYSIVKLHSLCFESIETLEINDPRVTSLPFSNIAETDSASTDK